MTKKQPCRNGYCKWQKPIAASLVVVVLSSLAQFQVLRRFTSFTLHRRPLETTTGITQNERIQDEKCKRSFEWSLMDHWEEQNAQLIIDFQSVPYTRMLRMERTSKALQKTNETTGTKLSDTDVGMSITVRSEKLVLTVVDMQVFDGTQTPSFASANLWHRLIPQYNSWVALQTAQRKYELVSEQVVYYFNCQKNGKHLDDLPNEWEKIGIVSCDSSLLNQADVLVVPPNNGFLWDLAWDLDFQCHNSDMFKTFAGLFVDKSSSIRPTDATGCLISRKGRPSRTIANWNETISMMKDIFPLVQVLALTQYHTTDERVQILEECRVLFGVHGAGHVNALFTRPGVAVVEMVGNSKPAYFRNINMLLGQYYASIRGDGSGGMSGTYTVNLTEARAALIRANDHASTWVLQHGNWR